MDKCRSAIPGATMSQQDAAPTVTLNHHDKMLLLQNTMLL